MDIGIVAGIVLLTLFTVRAMNPDWDFSGGCGCVVLILLGAISILFTIILIGSGGSGDSSFDEPGYEGPDTHWVDPYERSDGTEVDGYWRSNPDEYKWNNLNS